MKMNYLKKKLPPILFSFVLSSLFSSLAVAASGGKVDLLEFESDTRDLPSLQRGLAAYTSYCLGCHSLKYQRYSRTARDLGIPEDTMLDKVMFSGQKIGEHITSSLSSEDGKQWFGVEPPDLTMVTRVRSPEWVYSYLLSFYKDESRPFGVNNVVFNNVGMPHVLEDLQGTQEFGCREVPGIASNGGETRDPLIPGKVRLKQECDVLVVPENDGKLSQPEYEQLVADLTNYLHYTAEPYRHDRQRLGGIVLIFLGILFVFTWLLNREYWKDIKK